MSQTSQTDTYRMNLARPGGHGFHAHLYFDPATRAAAEQCWHELRAAFAGELSLRIARLGPLNDRQVGPHPQAQFEIEFDQPLLEAVKDCFIKSRRGLSVLIHPNSANERADHALHGQWIGAPVELDYSKLKG